MTGEVIAHILLTRCKSMAYESTNSPGFLETIKTWIAENGEVLVLIRFSYAAGSKELEFFTSFTTFRQRLARFSPRTCVTVFRQRHLPLRGAIDDDFIA